MAGAAYICDIMAESERRWLDWIREWIRKSPKGRLIVIDILERVRQLTPTKTNAAHIVPITKRWLHFTN